MVGKGKACVTVLLVCGLLAGCAARAQVPEATAETATSETAEDFWHREAVSADAELFSRETAAAAETAATSETADDMVLTDQQRAALDEFCASQTGSFSVYLQDLTTGDTYIYGAEASYYMASLLKAPYALWLCQLDDEGSIDLSIDLPNFYYGALTGETMSAYNWSETVPARTALYAMIAESDNDAADLLSILWPGNYDTGFTAFLQQLNYTLPETCAMVSTGIEGYATVEDIGRTMEALYYYFAGDGENAEFLQSCFLAANHNILYLPDDVPVAKKYGSWDGAFHDAAIVYAPYPYILCCMTDQGNTEIDFPSAPVAAMQTLGQMALAFLDG